MLPNIEGSTTKKHGKNYIKVRPDHSSSAIWCFILLRLKSIKRLTAILCNAIAYGSLQPYGTKQFDYYAKICSNIP